MINIHILGRKRWKLPEDKVFQRACAIVLKTEGFKHAEINLILMNDREIHEINKKFLNHDEPTDVITFPLDSQKETMNGELYLGIGVAKRTVAKLRHTLETELVLYTIHGTLHLCGYDDLKESPRKEMRRKEKFYLEKLGYKNISPQE